MIAIPNMDMPRTCYECDSDFASSIGCEEWWVFEEGKEKRSPDCPLIEIVQCKDCKWSYTDERDGTLWCKVHMSHYRVIADHFCEYGERRSE